MTQTHLMQITYSLTGHSGPPVLSFQQYALYRQLSRKPLEGLEVINFQKELEKFLCRHRSFPDHVSVKRIFQHEKTAKKIGSLDQICQLET